MKPIFYLSILLSSLLLTSCYRKFDLEEYRTTPKMVINSAFSPDTVAVSYTHLDVYKRQTIYVPTSRTQTGFLDILKDRLFKGITHIEITGYLSRKSGFPCI